MSNETNPMSVPRLRFSTTTVLVIAALFAMCAAAAIYYAHNFVASERTTRTVWKTGGGTLRNVDSTLALNVLDTGLSPEFPVLQLQPEEIATAGFTYYDTAVQNRIAQWLKNQTTSGVSYTASAPLAVLNPYGTGSNGLYLYFETAANTSVNYTIHVDDECIPDYTATAYSSATGYSKTHELQVIGLVPGKTNYVTLTVTGSWGRICQQVDFTITMPKTVSGYPIQLDVTEGESTAALSDGLYLQARTNGYLGYGFLFDNAGILRYELMLEGYGIDRVLELGDELLISVSANKLAKLDRLGRVTAVYELGDFVMHHDMILGQNGMVIILAERQNSDFLEDLVIELDTKTGKVTQLMDFKELLSDYLANQARPVAATDSEFLYYGGKWDWIHLNSVQYLPKTDSLIVSSRETSTVMKVINVHTFPELQWFVGDERFWADTAYADLCQKQLGGFVPQYGQHSVELMTDGDEDGICYLRMFNNNYFSLNHRDFSMKLDPSVGQSFYGNNGQTSKVYYYRIDENAGTFELIASWDIPYSSIVSNVSNPEESNNSVVNSGMSHVFGEYDENGVLIRQFSYQCTLQQYRTFKKSFSGFWFQ